MYDEMRNDGAPDIVILWNRRSKARRPYLCDVCGGPIQVGERYESTGLREDGKFHYRKQHLWAPYLPLSSPCRVGETAGLKDAEDRRASQQRGERRGAGE